MHSSFILLGGWNTSNLIRVKNISFLKKETFCLNEGYWKGFILFGGGDDSSSVSLQTVTSIVVVAVSLSSVHNIGPNITKPLV